MKLTMERSSRQGPGSESFKRKKRNGKIMHIFTVMLFTISIQRTHTQGERGKERECSKY